MTKEEAIKYLRQIYPNGGHCWLDEQRIEAIGMAIEALQEETVSSMWHDSSEEPTPNMELICVGQYGNPLVLSSNSDSFKSRYISKWAYFNDLLNLSNVQRTVKDQKEESVSEDLKAACEQLAEKARKHKAETKSPFFSPTDYKHGVIDGAKWQAEQFEKERLKQCDELTPEQAQIESDFVIQHIKKNKCTPTFIDAIEYGMKLQKEQDKETIELAEDHAMLAGMNKMEQQMMEKAIDGRVCAVYPSVKYNEVHYSVHYPVGVLPHKYGDKVKVIVIKEE